MSAIQMTIQYYSMGLPYMLQTFRSPKNVCAVVSVFFLDARSGGFWDHIPKAKTAEFSVQLPPRKLEIHRVAEEPERHGTPGQSYRKTAQGLCPIELAGARFGTGWLL